MAGLGIRLFTDEHIFKSLASELRRRGFDAEGCHEVGLANQRVSDEDLLAYATRSGRAILTENRADFLKLDVAWKAADRQPGGIILVAGHIGSFGELVRRVERHLRTHTADVQYDTLLWLDPSPTT